MKKHSFTPVLAYAALLAGVFFLALHRPARAADEATNGQPQRRVRQTLRNTVYATPGEEALKADIYLPPGEGPFPGVLCIHGGAWATGNKSQVTTIARRLAAAGYVAVAINYRLAPKHQFPAQFEDCRAALRWMQHRAEEYRIDEKRLAAWGYSAGGHLAALLATREKALKTAVAGGAPCDFRDIPDDETALSYWLGGTRAEIPRLYEAASPAAYVSANTRPIFFYHGRQDRLVDIGHPMAMATLLRERGVTTRLHVLEEAGHIKAFVDGKAVEAGIKFLDEIFKRNR